MLREPPKVKGRPRRPPVRGEAARNRLAEDNVKLVGWAVARFFRRLDKTAERSYSREDAHGDAWMGILRACELWEQARGALSSYAWWWMKQEMQRGLSTALNLIHSPPQRPEARVSCLLRGEWMDEETPPDRGEAVPTAVLRKIHLKALEEALKQIDRAQALTIRMRLAGSTWTEVASKLKVSVFHAHNLEREGQDALRQELAREVEE